MVFGFCIMYAPNFIQKTDTEGFGEGFKKLFSRPAEVAKPAATSGRVYAAAKPHQADLLPVHGGGAEVQDASKTIVNYYSDLKGGD